MEWVSIVLNEHDNEDESIEISAEPNGNLLLTSIKAQFPTATGLKFRNPETNKMRGVRLQDNELYPPNPDGTWGSGLYICVTPECSATPSAAETSAVSGVKRKAEDDDSIEINVEKAPKAGDEEESESLTQDLIVMGIPYKTSEEEMKKYFQDHGEVMLCQLKKTADGRSKGFGFVRFKDYEVQKKILLTRHLIDGRWCDVKASQNKGRDKIFVAKLTESITNDDLREHFEKFGRITDLFYPKPIRGFAFVTFADPKVAQSLIDKNHEINGVMVHITVAEKKISKKEHDNLRFGRRERPGRFDDRSMRRPGLWEFGNVRAFGPTARRPVTKVWEAPDDYEGGSMRSMNSYDPFNPNHRSDDINYDDMRGDYGQRRSSGYFSNQNSFSSRREYFQ